ncbi:MAG: CbiQ family ECF transporter T component [Methylophilaceae bacterium]
MVKINTKTQFILFFIFALTLNMWGLNAMLVLVFLLLLLNFKNSHFYRLMKRLKWFYLVMFLIFLFNTPGEHIANWPFVFKPTYEGLERGLIQVLRIVLMLAIVSVMLLKNSKQQLISGLYFLMEPLSYIGLDVKRFAARLWLTLHYVEAQQQVETTKLNSLTKGLAEHLNNAFASNEDSDINVTLEHVEQSWLDYTVICIALIILIIVFIKPVI